jgi:chaperonin GroEL (HSP60 family)
LLNPNKVPEFRNHSQPSSKTNKAFDGTTSTATILAHSMVKQGIKDLSQIVFSFTEGALKQP